MTIRRPSVAGMFYPGDATACRQELARYLDKVPPGRLSGPVLGGVVPHAGWVYSGPTAAHLYARVDPAVETVVLLGAVHHWGVDAPSVYPDGAWRSPLGDCLVDGELADALISSPDSVVGSSREAHAHEHSIEVQVPFVQYLAPEARILPLAVPPSRLALTAGQQLARAILGLNRRAVMIASSDLTHYGPRYGIAPVGVGEAGLAWTHENDARLLELAAEMAADGVMAEAQAHHNACGPGAVAAAIQAAAGLGATEGRLLHYTTSHEVLPQGPPTDLVGYGAIIYY